MSRPLHACARLLSAAAWALALLFCLPGCFTLLLWEPPGSVGAPAEGVQQTERSLRSPSAWADDVLCVPLSPQQRGELARVLPLVGEQTVALRITAVPGASLAPLRAAAGGADRRPRLVLRISVATDDTMQAWLGHGVSFPSEPCTVDALDELPYDADQPAELQIEVCRSVDHGSLTWSRVLWTPATLVLDAVTLPLQLVGLLVVSFAGHG